MWTHPDILFDLAKQHNESMRNDAERARLLASARRRRSGRRHVER
jgi:hypothetical protein